MPGLWDFKMPRESFGWNDFCYAYKGSVSLSAYVYGHNFDFAFLVGILLERTQVVKISLLIYILTRI